jgi:hypothetical protein
MDHDLERIADAQQLGIDRERQLTEGKDAFGFPADVDEHFVFVFLHDRAREYLALVEDAERLFIKALFER